MVARRRLVNGCDRKDKRPTHPRHSAARRLLEYRIIRDQVKRRKEAFIRRLEGMVAQDGDCVRYLGTKQSSGHGRMAFRHPAHKHPIAISIHRVFLILAIHRPIRIGFDAGHKQGCPHQDCVKHIFEQRSEENGRWAQAKQHGEDVPF